MIRALVLAPLLLTPLLGSAQNAPQNPTSIWVLPLNPVTNACPVDMHARQGVWDHSLRLRQGEKSRGFGQRIFLTLGGSHPVQIIAATVVVTGFDGRNRMLQTGNDSGTAIRTLHVTFTREDANSVTADIFVPGFTAVGSLRLQDMTFANGSTWNASGLSLCRVIPDPVLLIDAQ